MTNIARAADIISDAIWTDNGTVRGTATEAAQALADAGLLTPELEGPFDESRGPSGALRH